ncbi:MAG: ABC transporter substrate-binding protein [Hyphomicrobiales bacterium]|nr:ABC transporter substrate-binding protein [Hyphomicrobiales bacterium]
MKISNDFLKDLFAHEWSSEDFSRRDTLDMLARGGLAALLGATVAGSAIAPARADDNSVRIGYLPITDASALLIAHAKGYFKDEGLDAPRPTPVRSWAALAEGFAAGKFNLVHLLKPIPVWMRYNNKLPVKILAWAHTNGSGLVVNGKSSIHEFSDLGGKRIAVPFWYSMHNVVLQYALRESRLKPVIRAEGAIGADEVALQILPPPEMLAALAAGKIDGYIVAEPFNALGEIKAGARMLRFTGDIWKNHPCCVVVAHERDTIERPEWTQKAVNAVVRAQGFIRDNKAEAARILSQDGEGYLPTPGAVVVKAMTDYGESYEKTGAIRHRDWGNGRVDFQPWPYPSATRLIVEAMNKTIVEGDASFLKNLDPAFVAQDLVDYRFVEAALKAQPDWLKDPSVEKATPFARTEILAL